jgi:hypothetical protein
MWFDVRRGSACDGDPRRLLTTGRSGELPWRIARAVPRHFGPGRPRDQAFATALADGDGRAFVRGHRLARACHVPTLSYRTRSSTRGSRRPLGPRFCTSFGRRTYVRRTRATGPDRFEPKYAGRVQRRTTLVSLVQLPEEACTSGHLLGPRRPRGSPDQQGPHPGAVLPTRPAAGVLAEVGACKPARTARAPPRVNGVCRLVLRSRRRRRPRSPTTADTPTWRSTHGRGRANRARTSLLLSLASRPVQPRAASCSILYQAFLLTRRRASAWLVCHQSRTGCGGRRADSEARPEPSLRNRNRLLAAPSVTSPTDPARASESAFEGAARAAARAGRPAFQRHTPPPAFREVGCAGSVPA